MSSHTGRQITVKRSRRTATLNISQYSFTCFDTRFIFYFLCDVFRSTFPAIRQDAFCHHYNGIGFAFFQSFEDCISYILDVVRDFGDKNDVTATRHARIQGNPTGFMPHHFNNHHSFVRAGGRMQAVDGIRSDAHGGVKSKGNIRSPNIIINGFGD